MKVEYSKECATNSRCGNCPMPVAVEYVVVNQDDHGELTGIAVGISDRIDDRERSTLLHLGMQAASTIRHDGCYYTKSNMTSRNPQEGQNK